MSMWPWLSEGGRSEVAGSVLHGGLGKREYAGFNRFAGQGLAVLTACGYAAGVFAVFLAVDPLEQDVEQEVAAKNAKRQKYGDRHRTSRGPVCMTSADE
jgi:hypothetical protein